MWMNNFLEKKPPAKNQATAFAPSNIALIKYWGKRDTVLNLPITDSLSVTLPQHGTTTTLRCIEGPHDIVTLNHETISETTSFYQRIVRFINLFRHNKEKFLIETHNNIPTAAGLASSASGFAALTLALNEVYEWNLSLAHLSVLARIGSGSACRSFWPGFVLWQKGEDSKGLDSHGIPLPYVWPDLCLGLQLINTQEKPISSREAMITTVNTSSLYSAWPLTVQKHLKALTQAFENHDFYRLGEIAENNALSMHATMQAATPAIYFTTPETLSTMQRVWDLRKKGIPVFFTQDAGPNLKILFLKESLSVIQTSFPDSIVSAQSW